MQPAEWQAASRRQGTLEEERACSLPKRLLVVALASLTGLAAAWVPDLKPGLWESESKELKTGKTRTITMCSTKEVQALQQKVADDFAKNPNRPCKTVSSSEGGTREVVECTMNGSTWQTTSEGTISADLIHSVSHTVLIKANSNGLPTTIPPDKEDYMRFKGACPAGMEGGDMIGPDGKKVNMIKLWKQH